MAPAPAAAAAVAVVPCVAADAPAAAVVATLRPAANKGPATDGDVALEVSDLFVLEVVPATAPMQRLTAGGARRWMQARKALEGRSLATRISGFRALRASVVHITYRSPPICLLISTYLQIAKWLSIK